MLRWVAIVAVVVACKKKEEPVAEPEPAGSGARGYSVTKIKDQPETPTATGSAAGSAAGSAVAAAEIDAGTDDKDAPAYRDEAGTPRGPGGPVFMGKGPECTDKIDHCLRKSVWFAVGNVVSGKLYRATPVFEFEGKWWNWRGKETEYSQLFRTKIVEKPSELSAGSPVIWLLEENSAPKWLDTEHDALTTSRWEVGVLQSVGTDSIRVAGWDYPIPIDTARVIIDKK